MLKHLIKSLPPVQALQRARYQRFFLNADRSNLFFGVHSSFAAAAQAAPTHRPTGYDTPAAAELYSERHHQIYPADYPLLFWISQVLPRELTSDEHTYSILEIGGHTGVSFYAYEKYLQYPTEFNWCILDVPEVVKAGRKIARERGESRLSFFSEPGEPGPASYNLLLAAGALQYLETPLSATLAGLASLPNHILLNLLPVTEQPTYFTIQNMGPAFCPYKIVNRDELIDDLLPLGYELVDEWKNAEKACAIPYSPTQYSLDHYRGYYFRQCSSKS